MIMMAATTTSIIMGDARQEFPTAQLDWFSMGEEMSWA
jgi:hypothetical protein